MCKRNFHDDGLLPRLQVCDSGMVYPSPRQASSRAVAQSTNEREECMRKMILMAIAGFIWKKVQARMGGRAPMPGTRRRY
jgi:hypothetical protein